jgi:hypothetical protein
VAANGNQCDTVNLVLLWCEYLRYSNFPVTLAQDLSQYTRLAGGT